MRLNSRIQNLLWQYVYKDYYEARSDPFLDSEPVLMEHISTSWFSLLSIHLCTSLFRAQSLYTLFGLT